MQDEVLDRCTEPARRGRQLRWVYSHRVYIWSRCGRLSRSLYAYPSAHFPESDELQGQRVISACPVSPSLWGSVSGLPTAYASAPHVLPHACCSESSIRVPSPKSVHRSLKPLKRRLKSFGKGVTANSCPAPASFGAWNTMVIAGTGLRGALLPVRQIHARLGLSHSARVQLPEPDNAPRAKDVRLTRPNSPWLRRT